MKFFITIFQDEDGVSHGSLAKNIDKNLYGE